MIHTISIVALCMAGISFLLFVVALILQLMARSKKGAGAGQTQQEGLDVGDLAKLIEALAKLTEALNKAGPAVIAFVASLIFLILALSAASLDSKDVTKPNSSKTLSSLAMSTCTVSSFVRGEHEIGGRGLSDLKQAPDKCAESLLEGIGTGESPILFLIGHADQTKLVNKKRVYYRTNETLAYQRALQVKTAILKKYASREANGLKADDLSHRILIMEGGPQYLGKQIKGDQLDLDRSVELVSVYLHDGIEQAPASKD